MKALILKDLYNIGHNSKQMLILLLFFTFVYIPSFGFITYAFMVMFLCTAMIMTTFHFDKTANWEKYALTLPISKRSYIQSKFITAAIFCLIGALFSSFACFVSTFFIKKGKVGDIGLAAGIGLYLGLILGGVLIATIIRVGAENARNVLIAIIAIPMVLAFGIEQLMKMNLSIYRMVTQLKEATLDISNLEFAGIAVFLFILVIGGCYFYSYKTFAKKEW